MAISFITAKTFPQKLTGLDNVAFPIECAHLNLVQEPEWVDKFLTLEGNLWVAWDETQSVELGRFKKRGRAIAACIARAEELAMDE